MREVGVKIGAGKAGGVGEEHLLYLLKFCETNQAHDQELKQHH
jgi:hypothetical protein